MVKSINLPDDLFLNTVEALSSGVSISDASGHILYVNAAFEVITGYGSADVIGQDHSFLSYKKTPQRVYEDMWRTIASGKEWQGRLLNRRKDGSAYLSELKIVPILGENRRPKWFLGIQKDASKELGLEQNLAQQKALIENIIDVAPVVMALMNEHGKVLIDNQAYKVLMADLENTEQKTEHRVEPAWAFLNAISDGDPSQLLIERQEFDQVEVKLDVGRLGSRWFACSGVWVDMPRADVEDYYEAAPDKAFLLVGLDVTARMRAFQRAKTSAIRASTVEIQQAKCMREVLQGAVVELQAPLNMLSAATAMMERTGAINPTLKSAMDDVQGGAADTLEHLRNSLPMLPQEPILPLNINELVREVMDFILDRTLTEGVSLSWSPTPVLPAVTGKAGQLRTLIKILVDNAIDAVNEPGASDRAVSLITRKATDGSVEVCVCDTGPGVQTEEKMRIFDPFYSGWKKTVGRPGMGLAVAQSVLSEHGGTVGIHDGADGGCCVVVNLPAEDASLITRGDGS